MQAFIQLVFMVTNSVMCGAAGGLQTGGGGNAIISDDQIVKFQYFMRCC